MVKPAKRIKGEIVVPGDKSISHRAVILSSIALGTARVRNFLFAEDTLNTVKVFRSMGISISEEPGGGLIIKGNGLHGLNEPDHVLDLGNSGTGLRLLTGLISGQGIFAVLTGDESLKNRPMGRVVKPLREMGAKIDGRNNGDLAPLAIRGTRLRPIRYNLPIPSAQVKSSLLLAALTAEGETIITEPVVSRDHTERMLAHLGAEIITEGLSVKVKGPGTLKGRDLDIPGDLSSASFFIVATLLHPDSEILIKNVGINPTRTGILEILRRMGADIRIMNEREMGEEPVADIYVRSSRLKGIEVRGELVPKTIDEFPILCIAGSLSEGETIIKDARELRVKEADRIAAMTTELRKMGVEVEEFPDGMRIVGGESFKGARCRSFGDHRIAMALAIAGLRAKGETIIEDTHCVNTSFPGFFEVLESVRQ